MPRRGKTSSGALKAEHGILFKRIVDEVTGKIAEVRLDKNHFTFHCSIDEEYFASKNGAEVEAWAEKLIAKPDKAVEWIPVIEVNLTSNIDRFGRRRYADGDQEVTVDFDLKFDRWQIGRTHMGRWKELTWAQLDPKSPKFIRDELDRLKVCKKFSIGEDMEHPDERYGYGRSDSKPRKFSLPHSDGNYHLFAYDESLWRGLLSVADTIEREANTIRRLLGSTDGIAALKALGDGQPLAITAVSSASTEKPKRKHAR